MSTIFIERTVNLNGPIIPDTLTGVLNCGEVDSHEFTISATLDNEPFALSGVVTANFIRSDGVTVPLTGSISDGAAVVVLSNRCYNVPGRFAFTVFITSEGVTTAIYGCTGTVRQTDSGSIVDPGEIIPSVSGLITAIENAIAEIPADYSQLLATQASTFSTSTAYPAGAYVWYDGTLYRFTADHAAGSWTGSDATAVTIGGELADIKSAIASDISGFVFETANDKYTSGKYHNVEYRVTGNTVKVNGTANGGFRLKLSGANTSISNKIEDDWKNESLGLIIGHQYVMCVQYVSGSGSKVGIGINGSSSETLWVNVDPSISTPNATFFSEIFTANATNSSFLYVYTTTNRSHSNLIFRFNLIDITASLSLLNVIDNASSSNDNALHSYYFDNDYIDERMNAIIDIRAASSINSESFVWFTDPHYYRPTATQQENGMQSAQIMEYMRKQVNTRWIFCGGDMLRGTLTKAVCREYFKKTRSYLEPIYSDLFMALGNHEYNNTGSNTENELSTPELYEMFVKHQEMLFDSYSEKGDYTFTNDAQHVRYFVIGCTRIGRLFTQTIAWLAEALTHVENGYHVIIVSHIGMKTDGSHEIMSEFVPVCDIIDAVNTRTSYTYSGTTYNYSGANCEIVCALTGHTHFDGYVITNSGVPIIETMSDKSFTDQSSDAGLREVRTIGTIGEQSVNYVLIDFDAHKIHMIRIGGSYIGAAFDSTTGKIYDAEAGTGTEYTGSEWVAYSPYKDQHIDYTSHLN